MIDQSINSTQQLRSVAEKLNVFQDVEAREEIFDNLSRDLTNNLFILLRAAGLYDLDNKALEQPFEALLRSISGLYDLLKSNISLRLNDGNFFVNRRLVKLDFSTFQNSRYLIKIFIFLDINELTFNSKISRVDLKQLLTTFVRIVKDKTNNFKDLTLPNIEAKKLRIGEIHPLLEAGTDTEKVAAWYATACFVTQHFYKDAIEERAPQHALLKRTILSLIQFPSRILPILGRLDLLVENKERGGVLFIQSVEAAGLTALISDALELDSDTRLAMSTAALQLFQGWSLLRKDQIRYYDPNSTHLIFEALESPQGEIKEIRNEMIRTLLELGGVSESVIQRIMITFEAQRGRDSQWNSVNESKRARPSRATQNTRLYSGGLSRSFISDIVYGAHLYAHLRRTYPPTEVWREFKGTTLSAEVKNVFYQLIGQFPFGSSVKLNDGQAAIITGSMGEQVTSIAIIESGDKPLQATVKEQLSLRKTSPLQVQAFLEVRPQAMITRETARALIFSHLISSESKSKNETS